MLSSQTLSICHGFPLASAADLQFFYYADPAEQCHTDGMMTTEALPHFSPYALENFRIETLKIQSEVLKTNPLNDPSLRHHPLLVPVAEGPWPCVFILGGFSGNAPFYFNSKFNEQNAVQVLDKAVSKGEAPQALYVFVDALTTWGGSQFINSAATGRYEDFIIQEVLPALKKHYPLAASPEQFCVMGGSSGGYGALHLASKYPVHFAVAAAIAPDSFFEASLQSDLYTALPLWEKYQSSGLRALEELRNGKLTKNRNWHSLLNAFGMSACYSPKGEHGDFRFPLDLKGRAIPEVWAEWKQKDPVHFLPAREQGLKKLSALYLDVGTKDNFHLQYGARQISGLLKDLNVGHDYVEFDGNHFDIGDRRPEVWRWLSTLWRG